jgi:hypothetical protein
MFLTRTRGLRLAAPSRSGSSPFRRRSPRLRLRGDVRRLRDCGRRGWVADIEVLRPAASKWAWLKTDVTTTFVTFTPARAGTYQLRARLRDKALKKSSGFSPASTLRVS